MLNPELSYDDIVHAAVDIVPRVNFVVSGEGEYKVNIPFTFGEVNYSEQDEKISVEKKIILSTFLPFLCNKSLTYFVNFSVTIPFGWISTPLPQNLSLGWTVTWNTKPSPTTCTALTGGWWLTCNKNRLHQFICYTTWSASMPRVKRNTRVVSVCCVTLRVALRLCVVLFILPSLFYY